MRRTSILATASSHFVRLDYVSVRNWIIFALSGLLLGISERAVAAQPNPEARYSSYDDSVLISGAGSTAATRAPTGPDPAPSPTPTAEASLAFSSAEYWDALAALNLSALRSAAAGDAQQEFARGISLLADGDAEGAETSFIAASDQRSDINVGIASQIMLATTLLYEHKWADLRSFKFSDHLSSGDKEIIGGYQRWGVAFANTESQRVTLSRESALVRMRLSPIGTPTVSVRINGKQYDFWIDTGSSITVLSSAVAREVGVPVVSKETLSVRTFGGSAPVKAAMVRRIEIGPLLLENTPAVIIDAADMALKSVPDRAQAARLRIDGIIGWDTIRQLDLSLDFASGLMLIRRPERTGHSPHNLTWMGKPFVEVRTKRGETLHFTLDTGAQSSFVNAIAVDKTGAASVSSTTVVFGIAGAGRRTGRVIQTLPLDVGGESVRLGDVMVYGPSYSGLINCDGILGSDVARYGTIRIDATNGVFAVGLNSLRELD